MDDERNLGSLPVEIRDQSDRIAVIELGPGGQTWTPRQIDRAANEVALDLRRRGLPPGARVGLAGVNSARYLATYLGIMRSGLVVVPINHRLPRETVKFILSDCDTSLTLAEPELASRLALARWTDLASVISGPAGADHGAPPVEPMQAPEDVAEILYTSGSTGRPKGVVLTHSGQLWALAQNSYKVANSAVRTLIAAPLYHMNGLFFSVFALRVGLQFAVLPRFDARTYIQAVADLECTVLTGIPTMFALIARQSDLLERLDLSCVKDITVGSAPLTLALLDRMKQMFPSAEISNGYGTTEAGPTIFGPHPQGLPRPPLSVGCALRQTEVRLRGGASPDDGILEVRSPATFLRYLNLPVDTQSRRIDGWFSTGDVMRRDADGFYFFVGRNDDMFVCGGENVYPGQIEQLLERHPAVLQAAVVAVPDELKGDIPIAFVVRASGETLSVDEVRAFCLTHGPAYAHPRAIIEVDQIPMASTHKVDKRPLMLVALNAARALGRGQPSASAMPAGSNESDMT